MFERYMSKVITISNHKGGVGKTTSVLNIGVGLTRRNKDVLLIDLDPQANLTQSLLKQDGPQKEDQHKTKRSSNIYEAMTGGGPLSPIHIKRPPGGSLDLIPSTIDLSGAELELNGEPGREYILTELLKKTKKSYDFILIDTPPSIGLLTINSLTASDYVIIPVQAQYLAVVGLTKLTEAIEKVKARLNKDLKVGGVFLTQYTERHNLDKQVEEYLRKQVPYKIFKTAIRNNKALATAPIYFQDVFEYDKNSTGAEDYQALANEILNIREQRKK